jgi:hypothetical protein
VTKIIPLKNIFIKKYFIFFPEYLIQEEIREGLQGWLDTKIPIHFSLKNPYLYVDGCKYWTIRALYMPFHYFQKKERHLST